MYLASLPLHVSVRTLLGELAGTKILSHNGTFYSTVTNYGAFDKVRTKSHKIYPLGLTWGFDTLGLSHHEVFDIRLYQIQVR